jgi:RhtB (resistance to homoserine/threonine) family protein
MDHLAAYMLMALVMSMIPGADTILIMKNTLHHGAKAGRFTILGMATGLTFWTLIAVLGLSVAIAQSVYLFNTIKYIGAAYLFYLGIRVFLTKNTLSLETISEEEQKAVKSSSNHCYKESYMQGALSNFLNPKTLLVYITFMPQFINLDADTNQQLLMLGFILTLIAVGWFLILVHVVDYVKRWIKKPVFQTAFQRCSGVLLIGFGIKTIV